MHGMATNHMNQTNTFLFSNYRPRRLEIIDTTLREGSQTSLLHDHYKYFFNLDDKLEIVRALIIYGVKFLELFAPVVSSREKEDFQAIRAVRDELITQKGYTFLLAHVRCAQTDVEAAVEAGFDGLNFYIGTSDTARQSSHGLDLKEIAVRAGRLIEEVRRNYPHLILRFSGEDAFRTRTDDLFRVYDHIVPYVDRLGTPDTVGVATPLITGQRLKALQEKYAGMEFEGHFHNDRGFSLFNALEAVRSGMRYLNTTILGIGERSGITSLTALMFNLFIEKEYDLLKDYNLRESYPLNILLADKLNCLVPPTEPVSLTNRTHTAGVHQKAVLADRAAYEAHPLDQFGVTDSEILLGPLSGWNMVHYFLKEIKGFLLDEAQSKAIAARFKERVYQLEPGQSPSDFLVQLAGTDFGLSRIATPEPFRDTIVQNMHRTQEG